MFDADRCIHGLAGFSGLGNSYSNVGAAHLAARIAGAGDGLPPRLAETLKLLLAPGRSGARWPGTEPTRARTAPYGLVRRAAETGPGS